MTQPSTTGRPTTGERRDPAVRRTIDIAAAPDRVFRALTDPRELPAWFGGDDGLRTRDWTVDARPGGRFAATTRDADGREGRIGGEYRTVDAPRTLEHTWRASWDDAESTVRWELEPCEVDGRAGTRVTVTHTGPAMALGGLRALVRHATWTPRVGIVRRRVLAIR